MAFPIAVAELGRRGVGPAQRVLAPTDQVTGGRVPVPEKQPKEPDDRLSAPDRPPQAAHPQPPRALGAETLPRTPVLQRRHSQLTDE